MLNFGTKDLSRKIDDLERRLAENDVNFKKLETEFGTSNADEIIGHVKVLRSQIGNTTTQSEAEEESVEAMEPGDVMTRVTAFASKIKNLNTAVGSLEEQLASLYEEKERLTRDIGVSDAAEVVAMVKSLDMQLVTMYSTRELLERELGTSDGEAIVAMIKDATRLVDEIKSALGGKK